MAWSKPESTAIESVQGIKFQIDRYGDVLIGHGWVGDTASGTVFACVEEGPDWNTLRTRINEVLDDITEYISEEEDQAPVWVGLGSDYRNPPKVGSPETW